MPNTLKSHTLQPHAYPLAAREKLQQQQQQQQQQQMRLSSGDFSPSTAAPLSARPFMTMAAAAPFPALPVAAGSGYYYYPQQQQQQQQRRHAGPPPPTQVAQQTTNAPQFHNYTSYQQQHLMHAQSSTAAYAPSSYVSEKRQSAALHPRAAWRDEIEQRAAASSATSRFAAGVKRPAPSSPDASLRHESTRFRYDAAHSYDMVCSYAQAATTSPDATSGSTARPFAPATPPLAVGALPTLSCLLQRNTDASPPPSSSTAAMARSSAALMSQRQSQNHLVQQQQQQTFTSKRQRMFAPPPAAAATAAAIPLAASSDHHAADLAGADNRHLRSILEQEIAFYNQRAAPRTSVTVAATAAKVPQLPARSEPAGRTAGNSTKPVFYGTRPNLLYSSSRSAQSLPSATAAASRSAFATMDSPLRHEQHGDRRTSDRRTSDTSVTSPLEASAVVHARLASASTSMTNSSTSSMAQRQYARAAAADSSRSPIQQHPRQQSPFVTAAAPTATRPQQQQRFDASAVARTQRRQPSTTSNSNSNNHSNSSNHSTTTDAARQVPTTAATTTTTSTSGFRSSFVPNSTTPSVTGESVIAAASQLLGARSPSQRESITTLLLKSKEFLHTKSLVRNRQTNEIDWVATFLHVGFDASSIYSLMCPLRKGRWKTEEETYTLELLRLLDTGMLRLRHGQSIRGFIAKKLHSDDMRVLKKLSNCKQFHFSRRIVPVMADTDAIVDTNDAETARALARLEGLRSEFLRSVQLEALVAVRKYLSDSSIRELLNGS